MRGRVGRGEAHAADDREFVRPEAEREEPARLGRVGPLPGEEHGMHFDEYEVGLHPGLRGAAEVDGVRHRPGAGLPEVEHLDRPPEPPGQVVAGAAGVDGVERPRAADEEERGRPVGGRRRAGEERRVRAEERELVEVHRIAERRDFRADGEAEAELRGQREDAPGRDRPHRPPPVRRAAPPRPRGGGRESAEKGRGQSHVSAPGRTVGSPRARAGRRTPPRPAAACGVRR